MAEKQTKLDDLNNIKPQLPANSKIFGGSRAKLMRLILELLFYMAAGVSISVIGFLHSDYALEIGGASVALIVPLSVVYWGSFYFSLSNEEITMYDIWHIHKPIIVEFNAIAKIAFHLTTIKRSNSRSIILHLKDNENKKFHSNLSQDEWNQLKEALDSMHITTEADKDFFK